MEKNINKKNNECIYCGKIGILTNDHIPPKNIFKKPRPNNLITVKCCPECNSNAKLDDEYFRDTIVIREDVFNQPEAISIYQNIIRSFISPKHYNYKINLMSSMEIEKTYSKNGIYLGKKNILKVDLKRLKNVIIRITKGLFYKYNGERLNNEYSIDVYTIEDLIYLFEEKPKQSENFFNIIREVEKNKEKVIGNNVFKYKNYITKDNINISLWKYVFFDKVSFIACTLRKK